MMEQRRLFVNKRQSCFLNIQRYREGATARSAVAPSLLEERKQNGEFQAKKLFPAIRRIKEFIRKKRRAQQIGRVDFRYFCNIEKCFQCIITRCLRRDDALKALFFHYTSPRRGRRRTAASPLLGKMEHASYRFRFCSQVGKMGVFLLYFSYFSPTPYAAARRRASVVLRRRGNLITGNAAMRRCPFGGERVGAKTAFWMARALCFVVRLKNGWRKDIPPDGLRRIAAQAVRGDNASKKRIHNRTKMICFIRYNEV